VLSKKTSKRPKRVKILQLDFQELTVDVDKDEASPDPLEIDVNETFVISVAKRCYMRFANHNIFGDQDYSTSGRRFLRPNPGATGDAFYDLISHSAKARSKPFENTHSIKVGSRD
jgi:hypothetical protein